MIQSLASALLLIAVLVVEPASRIQLPSVSLEDQFQNAHTFRFPAEKPILLAVADHEGAEAMNEWIDKTRGVLGSHVQFIGVADVRKVPAFMRGFIRRKFVKAYSRPILLDWKGDLSSPLKPASGVPNIYLLSTNAAVLCSEQGPFSQEKLTRIAGSLNAR